MAPVCFDTFHSCEGFSKMFQVHLVLFLPKLQHQLFFQKAFGSFYWRMVLEVRVMLLIATGVPLPIRFFFFFFFFWRGGILYLNN